MGLKVFLMRGGVVWLFDGDEVVVGVMYMKMMKVII